MRGHGRSPHLKSETWGTRFAAIAYSANRCGEGGEDVGGFGADAEVGVRFAEDNGCVLIDDERRRKWEVPA